MLEARNNSLSFTFPEVHADAQCEIQFIRTLRLPDNDKTYPLPPGLGAFPLKLVDDYAKNLSKQDVKRGGVIIPMFSSEALWISFGRGNYSSTRGVRYPFALKIAAGKRSAITGKDWGKTLEEKDYVVIPVQPWLDGFMLSEGIIRQFIAAPLGQGFTVEEQLTKKAEFGGIQIEVFPMKAEEYEKRFPVRPVDHRLGRRRAMTLGGGGFKGGGQSFGDVDLGEDGFNLESATFNSSIGSAPGAPLSKNAMRSVRPAAAAVSSMGMAAGGRMKQDIIPDPYGLEVWDTAHKSRTFVHLLNSLTWQKVTGEAPPTAPRTSQDYNAYGLPWFEYYSDGGSLGATKDTKKIKSAAELALEKGYAITPENDDTDPKHVIGIPAPKSPHGVKDGEW